MGTPCAVGGSCADRWLIFHKIGALDNPRLTDFDPEAPEEDYNQYTSPVAPRNGREGGNTARTREHRPTQTR